MHYIENSKLRMINALYLKTKAKLRQQKNTATTSLLEQENPACFVPLQNLISFVTICT